MAFQKERRALQVKLVVPFVFRITESQQYDRPARFCVLTSMIRVALVEPEIPPNTGNIARLCAATRVPLHIVGVTGFRLDDRAVRRAGLDYWPEVMLNRHPNSRASL